VPLAVLDNDALQPRECSWLALAVVPRRKLAATHCPR